MERADVATGGSLCQIVEQKLLEYIAGSVNEGYAVASILGACGRRGWYDDFIEVKQASFCTRRNDGIIS